MARVRWTTVRNYTGKLIECQGQVFRPLNEIVTVNAQEHCGNSYLRVRKASNLPDPVADIYCLVTPIVFMMHPEREDLLTYDPDMFYPHGEGRFQTPGFIGRLAN